MKIDSASARVCSSETEVAEELELELEFEEKLEVLQSVCDEV
jgi:hypothetical protein